MAIVPAFFAPARLGEDRRGDRFFGFGLALGAFDLVFSHGRPII